MKSVCSWAITFFCLIVFISPVSAALEANEVLVIANGWSSDSLALAEFYMKKRMIPAENLLRVGGDEKEICSRKVYNEKLYKPVKGYLERLELQSKRRAIRCLLLIYGIPLKVSSPELTKDEEAQHKVLREQQTDLKEKYMNLAENDPQKKILAGTLKKIEKSLKQTGLASVDSELALVLAGDYEVRDWLPNPAYLGYRSRKIAGMPDIALMVSRLDGPTPKIVRRIINDSLSVEKNGLSGTAYFDARWPRPGPEKVKKLQGYGFYDNSLYLAADLVKEDDRLKVVINDQPELFQPGECPDAALYCGWYRLANYLDAFDWQVGAIAYHIASGEMTTLKNKKSKIWGKMMLEDGVAAVIGPVAEPYVQAFPPPALFFHLLLDGRFTLVECYALSVPFRSWRMVLVGDPLYRPWFRKY
jgi:uncharacterized protein (TIGR03790 family)